MKKLTFLLLLISIGSFAQDQINMVNGPIIITPILHGTMVIQFAGQTIYVDPYGGAEVFAGQQAPDLILITDIHGDHHNQATLDALDVSKATFVVPQVVADKLPEGMKAKAKIVANGASLKIGEIAITAVPMYNLPETEDSRHPKGRGNGYVLTMAGKRIYISGDTEDIAEMRALKNIDVAFICMNMPYTMDVDQAASAVAEFKPAVVYPYHYRGSEGLSDVEKFKALVKEAAPNVEVRLRQWYPSK